MQRIELPSDRPRPSNIRWTPDCVAARFEDAAVTSRQLPSVKVQGYFNAWPSIVRCQWEMLATDERVVCRFPPTPKDVEDMLEVMLWVQWLEVEQRHLVWMRAKRYGWREISIRFGCCAKTAQRRWMKSLQSVSDHLNAKQPMGHQSAVKSK